MTAQAGKEAMEGLYSAIFFVIKLLKNLDENSSSLTVFHTIKSCIIPGSLWHHVGKLRGRLWTNVAVVQWVEGAHG